MKFKIYMFRMTNIHLQFRIERCHDVDDDDDDDDDDARDAISKLSRPRAVYTFFAQAVAPGMSARQTEILIHAFVNI